MSHLQKSPVMDWTGCPDVESDPEKLGGTPILKHSRMPAEGIVGNYADGMSADEIADVFELPAKGVSNLLAYAASCHPLLKPRESSLTTMYPAALRFRVAGHEVSKTREMRFRPGDKDAGSFGKKLAFSGNHSRAVRRLR